MTSMLFFFFQAEDGIRDLTVTGVQTCALPILASPFSWIYRADIRARDQHWYEKNVMGTGPFVFVEYQRGSHWIAKKNPNYWDKGKPYLDGYRAIFIKDNTAQVAAIRSERAHIQFRGFTPTERDGIVAALGSRVTVQESPWDCGMWVAMNHEKKPWDDKRARRALTLALDRYQGSQALSRIAIVKFVNGVQVPGTPGTTAGPLTGTACWPPCPRSRAARPTPRSAAGTCGSSSGGSWTTRRTTSRRPSGTGSPPTAQSCAAGRSRRATI